jgi:hypothetical protein
LSQVPQPAAKTEVDVLPVYGSNLARAPGGGDTKEHD